MYRIEEFPEVIADACLRDSEGRFLFLSVFGRDNALWQFVSAMELPRAQQGIETFHLVDEQGARSPADVGGTDRLAKHSGRLPKQNIFGPLSHMWIYHSALREPDLVNRQAWVLRYTGAAGDRQADGSLLDHAWRMVQRVSPVPLPEAWREPLMAFATGSGMVRVIEDPTYPPLGPVGGVRIGLGQPFLDQVSQLVASGALQLPIDRAPA